MRGFLAKLCKKNGIAKRILSMSLAVLMALTTLQALPAGILVAHAETGNTVTIHWDNRATQWSGVSLHTWGVNSPGATGTNWPGVAFSANQEKGGWYTCEMTGLTDGELGFIPHTTSKN